jgi:hypothetical protein
MTSREDCLAYCGCANIYVYPFYPTFETNTINAIGL